MTQSVQIEDRAAIRVITINRPEKMNALDRETNLALRAAIIDIPETCRAILLTGAGERAFCSGADLTSVVSTDGTPRDLGVAIAETWNPLALALHTAKVPTICAVNGMAAGAGASLALGCDIVIAAKSARFLQAFARIGLIPDCGGTFHLPNLAGQVRARGMAMLAEPISAETALSWGLIWSVTDDAALMAEATKTAEKLASAPTHALILTRQALAAAAHNSFAEQLALEAVSQREAGYTPDHAEGVRAFREKRPAVFTGKAK